MNGLETLPLASGGAAAINGDLADLQEAFQIFNRASETLQRSYAELQEETRRLATELVAANEELQRAQRLQAMGEMAVQLAHEIRNPLGSIELFASLLGNELRGQADLKRWADQIVTGVKFLNTIVTNMLTFTKVSRPAFSSFDLGGMVEDTLAFLDPVCEQRRILARHVHDGPAVTIDADADMLRQMLINLLMNGLQAMPEQGAITVRTFRRDPDCVGIEVEDTGVGIPEENLARIFDPFFTTNEKGTGLGLSLVHQIVRKHGGTIAASSRFGQGARFSIALPLKQKPDVIHRERNQEV